MKKESQNSVFKFWCNSIGTTSHFPAAHNYAPRRNSNLFTFPVTPKEKYEYSIHNLHFDDPYKWLEDSSSQKVLNYLRKEENYFKTVMMDTKGLQDELKHEMANCLPLEERTEPEIWGDWYASHL